MTLLEMSLSAGAIILLTAALRLFAGGRLPRRMYVILWDIAALRLLLPVRITSSLSLWALISAFLERVRPLTADHAAAMRPLALGAAAQTAITQPQAEALAEDASSLLSRIGGVVTQEKALLVVWLVGALLLAAHFARAYARSMRLFRESLPDTHPETDMFLREHPMRRRVRVRLSGCIASPLSYGVMRPVILLPKGMDHGNARALHYVLLHELMHIRALDAVRKLLAVACLCLHWMNPLVVLMFLLVNRDMELLCDERVLAASPGDARREYALTLLAMEERRARLSPVASSFSVNAIEERIKAMMNMKKKSAASLLLAIAIVVTSSAALATSAPEEAGTVSTGYLVSGTYYFNPNGGKRYHSDQNCTNVAEQYLPMEPFGASQLEQAPYSRLEPCEMCVPQETELNVVWWTADEYRAWMENEREALLELVQEKAWAYTGSDGWFQWTQEKVEETMALYAGILRQIEDGALVSKTVDGAENVMLMISVPSDEALEQLTWDVKEDVVAVTQTIP